jgi:LPXTG-site transpeptidase (sortase) family protein
MREQLAMPSGLIWKRGRSTPAGTIDIAAAISAHHAQVALAPPPAPVPSSSLVPAPPLELLHSALVDQQHQWWQWPLSVWWRASYRYLMVAVRPPSVPMATRLRTVLRLSYSGMLAQISRVKRGGQQLSDYWYQSVLWLQLSIEQPLAFTFRMSGLLAMGTSVAIFMLLAGPIIILESQSLVAQGAAAMPKWLAPTSTPAPAAAPTPAPVITDPAEQFSLRIPDLGINSVVIPDVDIYDSKIYLAALKEGIAQAKGSGFPGQTEHNRTIFLFAHSTDSPLNILKYNAQFFALKDAKIGQKVVIRFWGRDYTYSIQEKRVVAATDTSFLIPQTDHEQLILQTCWPPGTSDKRLLILAVPSDNG